MSELTVAELIAELQRMPQHKPVKVVISSVAMANESGEWVEHLAESDAEPAAEVVFCGSYVLIKGDTQ